MIVEIPTFNFRELSSMNDYYGGAVVDRGRVGGLAGPTVGGLGGPQGGGVGAPPSSLPPASEQRALSGNRNCAAPHKRILEPHMVTIHKTETGKC